MARARNLKPGFFTNEDLVELPFEFRLLFAGLWTIADREGRLEDRPKKIKISVFPADDVNVDEGLKCLSDKGLIVRYIVGGKRFIQILTFTEHQNPHVKEAASVIPAPDEHSANTGLATPLTSSLIPSYPLPESETPNGKPPSLPKKTQEEINDWLDATAPLTGAKDRRTMANATRWRDVVEKAVREQHGLTDWLETVKSEANRNKGAPQFFTAENCLKVLQARKVKMKNGFVH